jgi:hypothetical protein
MKSLHNFRHQETVRSRPWRPKCTQRGWASRGDARSTPTGPRTSIVPLSRLIFLDIFLILLIILYLCKLLRCCCCCKAVIFFFVGLALVVSDPIPNVQGEQELVYLTSDPDAPSSSATPPSPSLLVAHRRPTPGTPPSLVGGLLYRGYADSNLTGR